VLPCRVFRCPCALRALRERCVTRGSHPGFRLSAYFSAVRFSFRGAFFLAFGSVVIGSEGVSSAVSAFAGIHFRVVVAVRAVELGTVPLASVSCHEFRTAVVARTIFGQRDDLWLRQKKRLPVLCCGPIDMSTEFREPRDNGNTDCACFTTGGARVCCGGCICLTCVVGSPELLNDSFVAEPTVLFEIVVLMVNVMLAEDQGVASWMNVPLTHMEKADRLSNDSL